MNFNLDWRSEASSYQNGCGGEQMSPKLRLIPECGTACEQAEEMSSEVCQSSRHTPCAVRCFPLKRYSNFRCSRTDSGIGFQQYWDSPEFLAAE